MKSFLILLLLLVSAGSVSAQEGLRPPLARPYLVAPVLVDGKQVVQLWIFPRAERYDFAVQAEPLMRALSTTLKEDRIEILKKRIRPEGVLTLQDLDAAGLTSFFDEASLELRLSVPLRFYRTKELNFNYIEMDNQKYQRPDVHSGYLNMRVQQSFQYGDNITENKMPLSGRLDLLENIKGFAFESGAEFTEAADYPWRRQDTRLRFDDEERMIRYSVGDLTLRSVGFQNSPNMAGISAVKEFAIQPYRTLRPLSNTEVVIQRTSIVEIYVNGLLFSQLRLGPGVFNIRDFPVAAGQSAVKIKVRDDLGQEETYDFSVLFENSLMTKDIQEFSYSVGMPWSESGADRAYEDQNLFASIFHRRGLTDQLTFGLNFQAYRSQSLGGIELSGISSLGYLSAEAAYGVQAAEQDGYAQKIRYRTLDRMFGRDVPVALILEAENRDEDFRAVSVLDVGDNAYLRRYDGQLNFRFNSLWFFGVGAGLTESLNEEDRRIYRSNLVVPLGARTRIEFSYNKTLGPDDEDRGLVSFYWTEKQGIYSASTYYDSNQNTKNLSLNRNNLYKYDDVRVNATVQNSDTSTSGNLIAEYLAQPGSLRFEHLTLHQNSADTHFSTVGLNTGIAWVGSTVALTQPISDSFIIVKAEQMPKDQKLIINPSGEKGEARLGPRKATVLRDQTSYYKSYVNVDSTSLPMGYVMTKEFFAIQPTYRSGILIDLNLQKKVMVNGRLVGADQKALNYLAGDVFDSQGRLVDNTFFTNKEGGFVIEGLEPGIYKVLTSNQRLQSFSFEIKDDASNVLKLGTISLKKAGE